MRASWFAGRRESRPAGLGVPGSLEDDYVIGIGLTPNRIDAASHIGVARDLAAYLKSQGKPVEPAMARRERFRCR